jgi:hypothetical protein
MKTSKIFLLLATALVSVVLISCNSWYKADEPMNGSADFPFNAQTLYSINPADSTTFTGIWLKGYIVGDYNNGACEFGAPFQSSGNILLADKPNETDPLKCTIVQFQYGKIKDTLNLARHAENFGKSVMVFGNSTFFNTLRGLKKVSGYMLGDQGIAPIEAGTFDNPYDVSEAMGKQNGLYGWVSGYIVGAVNGASISTGAVYAAPFSTASNLLLAASPTETSYTKCVPVQLTSGSLVATKLNLVSTPANLKRAVKIYGTLTAYFGQPGLKSTTGYWFLDGVTGGYNPGTPLYSEILSNSSFGQMTTKNVTGAQVWSATSYGATFNGTAGVANEDWLISPTINLTGKKNVFLRFDHTINYAVIANMTTEHTLWFSSDNGTTWTQVTIPTYPAGNSWTFVNSGDITVPSQYLNSTFKFAFKIVTSAKPAWEIKNVAVVNY